MGVRPVFPGLSGVNEKSARGAKRQQAVAKRKSCRWWRGVGWLANPNENGERNTKEHRARETADSTT
jgi:hypothetical protein